VAPAFSGLRRPLYRCLRYAVAPVFSDLRRLLAAPVLGATLGLLMAVLATGCGSGGEAGTAVPHSTADNINAPIPGNTGASTPHGGQMPGATSPQSTAGNTGAPAPRGSQMPGATWPPNEARPDPGVVDLSPVRWNQVEPAADGRSLTVHFTLGKPPCSVLGRVDTDEAADAVTVTLLVGRLPDADCSGPQPLIASPWTVTVQLGSPLDGRPVRDGADERRR
jgi:hypothetical protein